MKKKWEKVVSALLALVILVQLAPLPAFAATEGADGGSGALLSELEESASPAALEGEVEELRTEEGKHFRLSDGSYLSVSYGTPVHYQDEEGRWQDIDNTLTPDARSYHTEDNGGVTASFAKDLSHGQLASAACGDVSVSIGLLHPTQVQSLPAGQYDRSVTAEVEAEPAVMSLSTGEGWRAEDLVPAALSASVLYREVYPGVDLRYTAHSYDLKEQIILREQQARYRYDFLLTLDGLTAHLQEDGSVLLNDAQGAAVYRIPAPYMVDAEGNTSNAAEYLLQETAEGTVLSVEADKAWMDGASFPVTIDPTLIAEARRPEMSRSAAIHATYVAQKEPNTTHSNYQDLYLGYGITGGEQWGFFHFRTLPTVPEGSVVTGAALNLFIWVESDSDWGYSSVGCPELPLEMCEVTGANTDSDNDYYDWLYYMTWNNKPAVDTGHVLDYTLVSAASQGSYVSWDMTRAVKKWYAEGTENRTVAVLPADRGTYSSTHCALAKGIAYSQTYTPIFAVAYRNTTGIEPYYTYNTMGAGHAGSVWLADATGQVKVVKEAASYASTVNPFSVSLVYNSDYFLRRTTAYLPHGSGMSFGSGWTLDCVQKLAAQTIGGTAYLRYTDGDGTEHYFRKDGSRDSTYYYDEDGLGLKIRSVSGGYEMSDDKDNKYLFSGGYLKTITDANGNSVSMTYSGGKLTAVTQKNSGADSITVAALTYTDHRLTAIRDAAGSTMTLSYTDGKLTGIDRDGTALARYAYSGQRLTKLTDAEADYSLSFTYSGGRVSSYTESAGGSSGVSEMLGLPTSTTDALGTVSSSRYDALGRLTETEVAERAGVRYTYSKGQLAALHRTAGESEQVYAFAYDAFGNLTALQVGDRTLAGYTYAAGNGNLIRQTYGNGSWAGYGYDSRNRVTQQTDSEGRTRTYAYDPDSHLSAVTDSDGRTIRYVYDGLDRLTDCTVTQDGVQVLHTTQSYNIYGQTTGQSWVLDGTTYAQKYTYDTAKNAIPDGLLTSMTTGMGDSLSFSYDALGRLTGVGGKTSRSYVYADGTGGATTQIAQYSSSFGGKEQVSSSFTYNAAGNITEETTGGRTWHYTYDALGQLTGATDGDTAYTFTYDGAGNLLTASNGSESHTYTYGDADWRDLLTAYDGHAITYDGSGNPTTYYNGREWSFTWTGGRTLSGADSTDGDRETTVAYVYDLDGQRAKKTVTVRKYHTHAFVATETVEPGCLDGYTLETCSCGATRKTNIVPGNGGHQYTVTEVVPATCTEKGYTLKTCTGCGATIKTNYTNAFGHNKLTLVHTETVSPTCTEDGYNVYTCPKCNAQVRFPGESALGHNYVRDSASKRYFCSRCGEEKPGIEIPKPPISELTPIETPEEPLVPVEEAAADETAVQAEEERILESEVTTTYSYLYAGGKLLQETVTTGDATETHNFFYDNTGKPYAMQTGGSTYYYVTNLQGDVVALLDASGSAVASYTYDPYGKVLAAEGSMAETNPLRYRGYYYDTETGLYYLQSRYYDPATCRFVNADKYSSTDQGVLGYNMFAYCNNSPIIASDPDGEWLHLVVGAVVGGAIGALTSIASGNTDVGSILISTISGVAGGLLAASGAGRLVQAVGSSLLSMASNVVGQIHEAKNNPNKKFSVTDMLLDGAIGFASGWIGNNGASYGNEAGVRGVTKQLNKRIGKTLKEGKNIGKNLKSAWTYYAKNAHNAEGKFVIDALIGSYRKTWLLNVGAAAKNRGMRYLLQ